MLSAKKRGKTWRVEGIINGGYVRKTLSTRDHNAAVLRVNQIDRALIEGKDSKLWPELVKFLPNSTFRFFADVVGWREQIEPLSPTWADLVRNFSARFHRQILQGERSEATWRRYQLTCDQFSRFLTSREISNLKDISRRVVEDFKAHRLAEILARKHSRGGGGLHLDVAILHGVFAFAIDDLELLDRNPVKTEATPGRKPENGAQAFSPDELLRLRRAAGSDMLAFLLLRYTGLRGFDAVDLRWSEVDLRERLISRLTHKRRKQVFIPLHVELQFALEAEYVRRNPSPSDHVLLNPETAKPMKRPRLYERMRALGLRAEVEGTHPHRFRDTLAVDLLCKGASLYDVAKTLGDTAAVVEQHYAEQVQELRDRARRFMESEGGIEQAPADCTVFAHHPADKGKVQ